MKKLIFVVILISISSTSNAQNASSQDVKGKFIIDCSIIQNPFMKGNNVFDNSLSVSPAIGSCVRLSKSSNHSFEMLLGISLSYMANRFEYRPLVFSPPVIDNIGLLYNTLGIDFKTKFNYFINDTKSPLFFGVDFTFLSVSINRNLMLEYSTYVPSKYLFYDNFFSAFRPKLLFSIGKVKSIFGLRSRISLSTGFLIGIGKGSNFLHVSLPISYSSDPESTYIFETCFSTSLTLSIEL